MQLESSIWLALKWVLPSNMIWIKENIVEGSKRFLCNSVLWRFKWNWKLNSFQVLIVLRFWCFKKYLKRKMRLFANMNAGAKLYAFTNVVLASVDVIENSAELQHKPFDFITPHCAVLSAFTLKMFAGFILTSCKSRGKKKSRQKVSRLKSFLRLVQLLMQRVSCHPPNEWNVRYLQ